MVALLDEDRIKIQLTGSTITFNTRVVPTFNYTAESSIMLSLLLLLGFESNRKSVSSKKIYALIPSSELNQSGSTP